MKRTSSSELSYSLFGFESPPFTSCYERRGLRSKDSIRISHYIRDALIATRVQQLTSEVLTSLLNTLEFYGHSLSIWQVYRQNRPEIEKLTKRMGGDDLELEEI